MKANAEQKKYITLILGTTPVPLGHGRFQYVGQTISVASEGACGCLVCVPIEQSQRFRPRFSCPDVASCPSMFQQEYARTRSETAIDCALMLDTLAAGVFTKAVCCPL